MRAGSLATDKGGEIHCVRPDASLRTAANLMRSQQIGSLLVVDDQKTPLGLLTDRDIVAVFATNGAEAARLRVETAMQREIPTCDISDTLEHVMTIMTDQRTRHVLVLSFDSSSPIGILSIGDVVKRRLAELEDEHRLVENYIWWGR